MFLPPKCLIFSYLYPIRKYSKYSLNLKNAKEYTRLIYELWTFHGIFLFFSHDLAHLVTFETIFQISKTCKFCNLGFVCISFSTFSNVWDYFANFANWFFCISLRIGTFGKVWQISKICKFCKLIFCISLRIGTFGNVGHFANFQNLQKFMRIRKIASGAEYQMAEQLEIANFWNFDSFPSWTNSKNLLIFNLVNSKNVCNWVIICKRSIFRNRSVWKINEFSKFYNLENYQIFWVLK